MTAQLWSVVGLRALKRVGETDVGRYAEEVWHPTVVDHFEIVLEYGQRYRVDKRVLALSEREHMCSSGYCSAQSVDIELHEYTMCGPMTHVPKRPLAIKLERIGEDITVPEHYTGSWIDWSACGGDEYYPSGWLRVDLGMFEPTGRGHDRPLIHVFQGPSNLGKSTTGMYTAKALRVYDEDSGQPLSSALYADVVVLSGKGSATPADVAAVFKEAGIEVDLVVCRFEAWGNQ